MSHCDQMRTRKQLDGLCLKANARLKFFAGIKIWAKLQMEKLQGAKLKVAKPFGCNMQGVIRRICACLLK